MLVIFILLLSAMDYGTGQQLSKGPECDCEWKYFKHYEAKGCFPVYDEKPDVGESECTCPRRFDCSQADKVNSDEKVCVYKKHVYPVGSEIPTRSPCERCSCKNDYFTQAATITCITSECFSVLQEGCHYVYKENECCPTTECPSKDNESTYKVPLCEYKGKMYYEGEQIYPDEDRCLTCLCNSNWTGINSTTCRQHDCMLERYARYFKKGCIPIYHEKTCCPIEFHCPDDDFLFNVNSSIRPSYKSEDVEDEMCHFWGRYYPIGHVLDIKHPTHCVTCTCKTPPDFTCIHSSCPHPPNGDYINCRAIFKPNTCCPDYKCHENNVPPCEYKGKMYYGGEQIYPYEDTCLICLRNSNWTGINSTTCRQHDCTLQRDARKLKQGCIPIYHEKTCCRIEYHCPDDDFEFNVNRGPSYKYEDDEDSGTQNPGQQLSKDAECDCEWRYLKHYEAKGCRPVYKEKPDVGKSECTCPWRFDCSQADEVNSDKNVCVYKKHVYPEGSEIPLRSPCEQCSCLRNYLTQVATITCTISECFTVLPEGCHYVYKENECCPTIECPAKGKETTYKVPLCEYKGKMYYEGEKIYPDEDPCLICLCNSNWTGINGTTCGQQDCMLERYATELDQGCIPIYHEKTCCPIEYHCPKDDFEFKVNRLPSYNYEGDEDEMCHFEGRYYPIGHVLDIKHPTHCVTCTCKIPPDFTCIHSSCPHPPNADYINCRAIYKPNTCCLEYQCHKKNGISCEPFDCMRKERTNCDASLLPTDFPETPEELRTICSNVNIFGTCMMQAYESCGYNKNFIDKMRKGLDFTNTACDEDHPIFKVISSNLGCITPIARKVENECNQSRFMEENYDAILAHEMRLSDNFDRMDVLSCLTPFWEVNCRSIVMGLHCGSDVKEAVKELLSGVHHSYNETCTRKILEELQPLSETYETAIEAEQRLKNEIKKRK